MNEHLLRVGASATLAVKMAAQERQEAGLEVYGLGPGEPDFPTPEMIAQAAVQAIPAGHTKYTAAAGIMPLREKIAAAYNRRYAGAVTGGEVIVTNGAKQAVYNALFAILEPGDEVVISTPYWVSFPAIVRMMGADFRDVQTDWRKSFAIEAEPLLDAINQKTKMVIINSPCNPSGGLISREEMRKLVEGIAGRNIYLLSDETYDQFVYPGNRHHSILEFRDLAKERLILANSFSKTYSMTGWRIGYLIGPETIVRELIKLQSHSTSNPSSISQYAALAALDLPQSIIAEMLSEYDYRRNFVYQQLRQLPGISITMPNGAFYAFPKINHYYRNHEDSVEFSRRLLAEAGVAVVPGGPFGMDDYVRISYAAARKTLREGLAAMAAFLTDRT